MISLVRVSSLLLFPFLIMSSLFILIIASKILKYTSSTPILRGMPNEDESELGFGDAYLNSQITNASTYGFERVLLKRSDASGTRLMDEFSKMMVDRHVMLIISIVAAILLLISLIIALVIYRRKGIQADIESKKHQVVDLGVFHDNPLYKD